MPGMQVPFDLAFLSSHAKTLLDDKVSRLDSTVGVLKGEVAERDGLVAARDAEAKELQKQLGALTAQLEGARSERDEYEAMCREVAEQWHLVASEDGRGLEWQPVSSSDGASWRRLVASVIGRCHPTFWRVSMCMCAEGSARTLSTARKACNGSQFSKRA